ncbi:bax inhibitor 1, partial [Medicago truncatula]|uniref:bax inhibitor 1 n=1 Tax=Medicago truncatula TaxID=3880 RepID=UPI00196707BD
LSILGLNKCLHCILSAFKCLTTFVATSLAFACFSAAALVARRREYLYLGGLLSSGLSILMWLHFASSVLLAGLQLYFGLLVFVGYVVVDTQEIIERSQNAPILH